MLKPDPSHPTGYRAPRAGEIIKLPNLAQTFRTLAAEGKPGFYTGRIASSLIATTAALGGHLTLSDLANHMALGSEPTTPLSLPFAASRLRVWEHPPNSQGLIALLALGILTSLRDSGATPAFGPQEHNTTPYLHAVIEALRLAFSDGNHFIADPATNPAPDDELLSPSYLASRAALFDPHRALPNPAHGTPSLPPACDTVYLATADAQGNAMSFINSNYGGFGTGIIPQGCGFTLQNRGAGFSLDAGHANVLEGGKRPFHTIIPGLVTREPAEGEGGRRGLHSVFGVMGGWMQPQGHVQVLLGQVWGGLSPQQALDAPRVCVGAGMPGEGEGVVVYVEEGMGREVVEGLRGLGHRVEVVGGMRRAMFGRGQVVRWNEDGVEGTGVWSGGSDGRGDGGVFPA